MVKANGYGHGIEETALRLDQCVDLFGVASIDEAMQLRNANIRSPILLAQGIFTATELETAAHHNFHVVFHQTHHIDWLMNSCLSAPVHAWIKVNTGLCRLGFPVETAHKVYTTLTQHPSIQSVTLMTHFACANDKMHPMNQHQIVRFHDYVKNPYSVYSTLRR
jgi:alanine racemase